MPILAALFSLGKLFKVGAGLVGALASSAILAAAFVAWAGSYVAAAAFMRALIEALPFKFQAIFHLTGVLVGLEQLFQCISTALAIRFARFVAVRTVEAIKGATDAL